jgi:alpha,alpha-trehalose phosphorylase
LKALAAYTSAARDAVRETMTDVSGNQIEPGDQNFFGEDSGNDSLYMHPVCGLPDVDEIASWRAAADDMYIPYDAATGIYPQDDSFMDKQEWDFAGTPKNHYPLLLHYHPLVIYRHRVLKQPDLVLAQFVLSSLFTRAEKIRNFDFYEPYTTGDSSLSHCIQSIMAAETGNIAKAEMYFDRTVRMDIDDVHGNTRDGIHTASMAGSWMSVVYGFAGFRDHGGVYRFDPHLLPRWKSLRFSLRLHGCILDLLLGQKSVTYTLREGKRLDFFHRNIPVTLSQDQPAGTVQTFSLVPELRAVLFDLDGVITDTAELHYQAWKRISDENGLLFDRSVNERLRGISRNASFGIILEHNHAEWSPERITNAVAKKNAYYMELLETLSEKDVLPGILPLLDILKVQQIRIVLASASRNAPVVCKKIGILSYLDALADPEDIAVMKPAPDIFLRAAELAGVWYTDCIGVEDAQAGIDAIRKAGMCAVGIGTTLSGAHALLPDTSQLSWEILCSAFERYHGK